MQEIIDMRVTYICNHCQTLDDCFVEYMLELLSLGKRVLAISLKRVDQNCSYLANEWILLKFYIWIGYVNRDTGLSKAS